MSNFIDFPTFNFSLTCGNNQEVRQWLKDNGVTWDTNHSVLERLTNKKYLDVTGKRIKYADKKEHLLYPIINPFEKQQMTAKQITLTEEQIKLLGLDPSKQITLSIQNKPEEKWEPKAVPKGDSYYRFTSCGNVYHEEENATIADDNCRFYGNYFSTEEEAKQALAELRAYLRLRAFAKEHDGNWKPDWEDMDEEKCYIYYNYVNKKYMVEFCFTFRRLSIIYMSKDTAKLACKMLNEGTLVL